MAPLSAGLDSSGMPIMVCEARILSTTTALPFTAPTLHDVAPILLR